MQMVISFLFVRFLVSTATTTLNDSYAAIHFASDQNTFMSIANAQEAYKKLGIFVCILKKHL